MKQTKVLLCDAVEEEEEIIPRAKIKRPLNIIDRQRVGSAKEMDDGLIMGSTVRRLSIQELYVPPDPPGPHHIRKSIMMLCDAQ
ncbi:hypothetical protein OUZ56_031953 [Daphnia magna]|uniref:Uncharacterized protein n=1 Tax=Daphnia magna TaxID=35525 RepID=A0ABQ9ZVQ0_9CRUS|nr:hypothetical protein OUZ56_031953 [Daphnia magna]